MAIQTLSPNINTGSILGQALGEGIQTGATKGIDYQVNRSRLQNALGSLKNISPDASPFELATSLIGATAGIPGAERYVGQLFPLLMNQLQAKKFGNTPQPGQQTTPGLGQNVPGANQTSNQPNQLPGFGNQQPQNAQGQPSGQSPTQTPNVNLAIQLPAPALSPFGTELEGIDLGIGPVPRTYSEDQYRQVANQYTQSGLDPTPAIEQMKLEDSVSRKRLEDLIGGAETVSKISTLRRGQQEAFREILREQLPHLNEQDFAVAERIAQNPQIRSIKNDKIRAEQVRKEFNLFQAAKKNLEDNSTRRDYDEKEYQRQKHNLGNYTKTLVSNGQRDLAEGILASNGWGPVEISEIINPIPKEVESGLKKLPIAPDPQELIRVSPDDPKFDQEAEKAIASRDKILDKYKDYIAKNFKTGSYDPNNIVKTGTSLLQLRDLAMQNNVSFQEFEQMINDLVNSGKIELDSYQLKDLPLLSEHPNRSFSIGEILWRLNPLYNPRK